MTTAAIALLQKHFDIALEAPDGIKRLRELILTLAMQGKLVPQDPNDQPASELLKEIETEKKRLVKEGKIKAPKLLPEIEPEEVPYAVPKGWEWTTLCESALINPRNNISDTIQVSFVPMTLIGSGYDGRHRQEVRKWSEVKQGFTHFAEGDIGVAKITPCFENSKACIFSGLLNGYGAGTTELHIVRTVESTIDSRYILFYLKAPQFLIIGETKMTGTAGQKRLPKEFVDTNPFPLPPLAEQKRIVAKIDQLMATCDALEQLRNSRQQERLDIHTAAITRLLDAKNPPEAEQAWVFLQQHFGELYAVKENVAELRKAILQLAVMGKLVPQDPKDQPASELLKEIEAEKKRLVKEGKIKPPKPLPEIKPEDVPYTVPKGWEWVRLGDLLIFGPTNGYSPNAVDYETGVRSLTLSATTSGVFKPEHYKNIVIENKLDDKLWLERGDILIQRGNTIEYVGVSAIYDGPEKTFIYPDLMMKIKLSSFVSVPFLHKCMSSEICRDYFRQRASGTSGTMPKINQETVRLLPIPLPPLAEQKRIVAKIDQLMVLCDSLEQGIEAATQKQSAVLGAVLAQV